MLAMIKLNGNRFIRFNLLPSIIPDEKNCVCGKSIVLAKKYRYLAVVLSIVSIYHWWLLFRIYRYFRNLDDRAVVSGFMLWKVGGIWRYIRRFSIIFLRSYLRIYSPVSAFCCQNSADMELSCTATDQPTATSALRRARASGIEKEASSCVTAAGGAHPLPRSHCSLTALKKFQAPPYISTVEGPKPPGKIIFSSMQIRPFVQGNIFIYLTSCFFPKAQRKGLPPIRLFPLNILDIFV